MMPALRWILSLIFNIQMYIALFVVGLAYLPATILNRDHATSAAHAYCRWVRFSLRVLCGLHTEVRGTPPIGAVLIAAKHQSFLDIIVIYSAVPRGRFIMKDILRYAPVLGWYALRLGSVPIKRGARGAAITKMAEDVKAGLERPGQLIIYPQGTRVAPGEKKPYKIGTAALYAQLEQPCHPVATNIAIFWPKRGILRKPGLAVVEFLAVIPPGLPNGEFMTRLESVVESNSDRLMAEAGWKAM
jgi:1-acyl-sn-glycerol-3-phosphate acyltransferase